MILLKNSDAQFAKRRIRRSYELGEELVLMTENTNRRSFHTPLEKSRETSFTSLSVITFSTDSNSDMIGLFNPSE